MTTKKQNAAGAAKVGATNAIGTSKLKGFRYYKGLCFATLINGIQGCIGESTDYPFATMLSLKGQGCTLQYEHTGTRDGYENYRLSWDLQ